MDGHPFILSTLTTLALAPFFAAPGLLRMAKDRWATRLDQETRDGSIGKDGWQAILGWPAHAWSIEGLPGWHTQAVLVEHPRHPVLIVSIEGVRRLLDRGRGQWSLEDRQGRVHTVPNLVQWIDQQRKSCAQTLGVPVAVVGTIDSGVDTMPPPAPFVWKQNATGTGFLDLVEALVQAIPPAPSPLRWDRGRGAFPVARSTAKNWVGPVWLASGLGALFLGSAVIQGLLG